MEIILHRLYLPEATHGILQHKGVTICFMLELPWAANQRSISCIPEGTYTIQRRYSSRFKEHFEVLDVPDRSAILIHPANNAKRELRGCLAPVSQLLAPGWGSRSKIAMAKLTRVMENALLQESVILKIQTATVSKLLETLKSGQL